MPGFYVPKNYIYRQKHFSLSIFNIQFGQLVMLGWGEQYIVLAAPYLDKIHMMCVLYNSDMRTVFFMYIVARQDFSAD